MDNNEYFASEWLDGLTNEELAHYGIKRKSGRYPYGSGKDAYQHEESFSKTVKNLRASGMTDTEIARALGMNTSQFRARVAIESNNLRKENISRAVELKNNGYTPSKIAEIMGVPDSTVRGWLKPGADEKTTTIRQLADEVKKQVDRDKYVDVGKGTNINMGCSEVALSVAVSVLEEEGYRLNSVWVNQLGTGNKTQMKVLTSDDVDYTDLVKNHKGDIKILGDSTIVDVDGTKKISNEPPTSVNSKRIMVKYGDEGGVEKDGLIEVRRGCEDLSLGDAHYAQVRIAVDGTHYLKGMCVYADDLPPGVDIRFNTNKKKGTPLINDDPDGKEVLKRMKSDPDNPFGASIKDEDTLRSIQRYYIDENGKKRVSPINVVNEEGDWSEWSKTLASQFLSKQSTSLARRQIDLAIKTKAEEFNDILALDNPVVRKKLLESFADDCDASAIHLKAAALPRQASKVILPFSEMKDNEIYCPTLENGTTVCLVRYPHGGTFEIPELVVNNKKPSVRKIIGNAKDAVGINGKVAEILSGADFDGDTVLVLPESKSIKIKTKPPLKDLEGFDPKEKFPYREGMTVMNARQKGLEMGKISNLITDMTLQGASDEELARAVKHSMVVIDAQKHKLDYKASEVEYNIAELKKIYQNNGEGKSGVATIISRAKSPIQVNERKDIGGINKRNTDPETGEKIYEETGSTYKTGKIVTSYSKTGKSGKPIKEEVTIKTDKDGKSYYYDKNLGKRVYADESEFTSVKTKRRQQEITRMEATNDAYTLTSGGSKENPGTQMEGLYAAYANQLKSYANQARKEYLSTPKLEYDPKAAKEYSTEVSSLKAKLNVALKNAPRERQAQLIANEIVNKKLQDDPALKEDTEHLKKEKGRALTTARQRVGAKKERVTFTEKEWEAVQKGAIHQATLEQLLNNADDGELKQLATPRAEKDRLSASKQSLIRTMNNAGYTQAEIADRIGVSASTVSEYL